MAEELLHYSAEDLANASTQSSSMPAGWRG
jgi:hypothetical protein